MASINQRTAMSTPHELIYRVHKLISLPDVYLRVKAVVDDPDSSIQDVIQVVAHDPGITARLLKVANSPYFGFVSHIETVSHAVNLLGMQQVHDLVLATSVAKTFSGISSDVMNMDMFWRDSIYCGVIARLLANRCNVLDSERLFVEGLLRDIGHLLMYLEIPNATREALAESERNDQLLFHVERELIGFDYAQVGAELMRVWKLPPSLIEAIEYHIEPGKAQEYPLESAIVHIAGVFTTLKDSEGCFGQPVFNIDPAAWHNTDLTEDDLEPIIREADQHAAAAVAMLLPDP
jgi:HD-like signal output (HDOD) protein